MWAMFFLQAKTNLSGMVTPEAKSLQLTCSLNLMSCYLKTQQYQDAITEGTEVFPNSSVKLCKAL